AKQIELVLGYLDEYGITELDYLVATHPHADHIGAMSNVIRAMDRIGEILMPDAIATTAVFERMLDAIEEKDVPITNPNLGDIFMLGEAKIQVLAPYSAKYSDANDYSIVLHVEFGSKSFLLTGDAEKLSEAEQLRNKYNMQADVLKAGHHGSRTSSSQAYLDVVNPTYVVISCGVGNSYGHPHSEAMERYVAMNFSIYRTDLNGTIIFTTDGTEITVSLEKGTVG
ncbi:MAG: MBL fold metallo-hydrolase, partial [Dehalococcoidia bacterium]|nr:MBL fold metallo-hydrolase [Dehalococcoidia bacterium]